MIEAVLEDGVRLAMQRGDSPWEIVRYVVDTWSLHVEQTLEAPSLRDGRCCICGRQTMVDACGYCEACYPYDGATSAYKRRLESGTLPEQERADREQERYDKEDA